MSFNAMVRDVTEAMSEFWLRAGKRFIDAKTKAEQGTFTTNEMASNVVGTFSDAFTVWIKAVGIAPKPIVPTVWFSDAAGTFVGHAIPRSAYLTAGVTKGTPAKATDLILVSDPTKKLPQAEIQVAVTADDEVEVTLSLTAPPNPGLYLGVAFEGAPPQVLVQIVVLVT